MPSLPIALAETVLSAQAVQMHNPQIAQLHKLSLFASLLPHYPHFIVSKHDTVVDHKSYFTLSPQLHNGVLAAIVMIMVVQIHYGHGIVVGGGVAFFGLLLL